MDRARRAEPYSNATIWARGIAKNMAGHLDRVARMHSCVDTGSSCSIHLPQFHLGSKSLGEKSKAGLVKSRSKVDEELCQSRANNVDVHLAKLGSKHTLKQPRLLAKLPSTSKTECSASQSSRNSCDRIYDNGHSLNHQYNSGKGLQRSRAHLRIWEENQMILKRILATKSILNSKKWEEDEKRNKKWLRMQEKRRRALQQELEFAQSCTLSPLRSQKESSTIAVPITNSTYPLTAYDQNIELAPGKYERPPKDQLAISTQSHFQDKFIGSSSQRDCAEQEAQEGDKLSGEDTKLGPRQAHGRENDFLLHEVDQNNLQICELQHRLTVECRTELDFGRSLAQEAPMAIRSNFDNNSCLEDIRQVQSHETLSEPMVVSIASARANKDDKYGGEITVLPIPEGCRSNTHTSSPFGVFPHTVALNQQLAPPSDSDANNLLDVRTMVNETSTTNPVIQEDLSEIFSGSSSPIRSDKQEESYHQDEESDYYGEEFD